MHSRRDMTGYGVWMMMFTPRLIVWSAYFADDDRVAQVQKGKWELYYHIRNTIYFNQTYGRNWFVRKVRPFGLLLKYGGMP